MLENVTKNHKSQRDNFSDPPSLQDYSLRAPCVPDFSLSLSLFSPPFLLPPPCERAHFHSPPPITSRGTSRPARTPITHSQPADKALPSRVRLVPGTTAGCRRRERRQVGDGGSESGSFLSLAAMPRRVEDVEESVAGHEPCKRERAVEHGVEEGASERQAERGERRGCE